jgi:hypothetical protein
MLAAVIIPQVGTPAFDMQSLQKASDLEGRIFLQ